MLNALTTHRKCLVCGETTSDLSKEKCKRGHYMHMVSQMYSPKTVAECRNSALKGGCGNVAHC